MRLACVFLLLPLCALAQSPIYKGLRISLFAFETTKQAPKTITLRCSVANSGRYAVAYGKNGALPHPMLVVELDSQAVPALLRGRERLLCEAVKREKISLSPGAVRTKLELKINLQPPPADTAASQPLLQNPGDGCPDLVFDTVFVSRYTDKMMTVQYVLRNQGNQAANLLGANKSRDDNMAVNVYFSGGLRLTRGAILADGEFVREGRETLDGLLLPGQQLHGSVEVSLKNRTRFSPNLIVELDPFQTVQECDRANNVWGMKVEY
jgi:hypothetical protein